MRLIKLIGSQTGAAKRQERHRLAVKEPSQSVTFKESLDVRSLGMESDTRSYALEEVWQPLSEETTYKLDVTEHMVQCFSSRFICKHSQASTDR